MKMNKSELKNNQIWQKAGVELPQFDVDAMVEKTKSNPKWLHFGAGNIFRGFVGSAQQTLLNEDIDDIGIIAAESFDFEIIEKIYDPYDNLTLLVTMKPSGVFEKKIVASIAEGIAANLNDEKSKTRLVEIFKNKNLQIVSFTITEKGYALKDASGDMFSFVADDIENGIKSPKHTMSIITSLLYERYKNGAWPLTLVSMDNCSHNGDKLKEAVITVARGWSQKGYVEKEFLTYLEDESKITFPLSMIDKITPRPSEDVFKHLSDLEIEGMDSVITSKNTYIAPFVNAEETEYLVIEDKFTNGRPALEKAGIIFTDRNTVNMIETMKVTTCLNPLHTALAVTGCLLGHTLISEEMKDSTLKKLVEKIGYDEGLKVVVDPGIINPKDFIDEVINQRFANPFVPDAPQRIATDTSQKVGIRFGETIKSYQTSKELNPANLVGIPLAIAAWLRYLMGIDDEGNEFTISPDPMADELQGILKDIKIGDNKVELKPILSNAAIFGVDLYQVGLGDKIENMVVEMISGKGAVRSTLDKYLG